MLGGLLKQVKAAKRITSGDLGGTPFEAVRGRVSLGASIALGGPVIHLEAKFTVGGKEHSVILEREVRGEAGWVSLDGQAVSGANVSVTLAGKITRAFVVYHVEAPDLSLALRAKVSPVKALVGGLLG